MSVKDGLTSLNHCCTCSTDTGLQMVNWSAWWTVERHHLTATSKKKARLPGFPRQGRLLSLLKALNKIQLFSEASEWSSIKITLQRTFIRILAFHLDLGPSSAPPCLRRFPRLRAAPHSSIANQSMWSPQKPTWLSNVSPLSFIIPSVAPHSGRLALICDLFFSTSSRCLRLIFFIFMVYLSSHILPIVASYSLCSLSESSSLIAQTLDSIQNLLGFSSFFYLPLLLSHATSSQTPFSFPLSCCIFHVCFFFPLSLLFISADKYLIMSALTWHHCSLLELRVFRSRSRGWRRKHAALSNIHLSPFYLVTKPCRAVSRTANRRHFLFLLCQNERGCGAQLQIQASIQQGF